MIALLFTALFSFCIGGIVTTVVIKKAVDETMDNPDGRWARTFQWLARF